MPIRLKSSLKPQAVPNLTPEDVDAATMAIPPYPGGFQGRGITICAGGFTYFTNAWILMRMLRMLGNKLPIQFWHYGDEELDSRMRKLVAPFDVECVDASKVALSAGRKINRGWPLKPLSILYSPFKEVLALDADNIPVRDPKYLFECNGYRETGAIFWPDQGRTGPTRAIWDLMKVAYRDEPEFETGQVVVNKELCWEPLNLAMWMNEEGRADFIYNIIWGDKDTFRFAWHKFGFPFAMTKTPLQMLSVAGGPCCIGVMCQHDLEDERIFQHRNIFKWHLFGMNPWVPGFLFEGECREYLTELKAKWNGKIGQLPPPPEGEAAKIARMLIENVWLLDSKPTKSDLKSEPKPASASTAADGAPKATSFDPWPSTIQRGYRELRFSENGTFGPSSDQLFTFWSLKEDKTGTLTLVCAGVEGAEYPTAQFNQKSDGTWIGRSLKSSDRKVLRLQSVKSLYPSAETGVAVSTKLSSGNRRLRQESIAKRIRVFNSAHGIGDHVVSLYACVGAVHAGFEVIFHTRFPDWLGRVQHPGLTITGDLPPGLANLAADASGPAILPKGVVDLNHDPALQMRFGRNRALWYADAIQSGLQPMRPAKVDRAIAVPRFDFSRYVVLAPFSAWSRRDWPAANWTRLTHLLREAGFEVVAIGTTADAPRFEAAFTQTTALWAIDHPTEWVLDALLGASCVIGNDSGISHLAGLLGLPTIAIHAHLSPDFLFSPAIVTSVTPRTNCTFCRWQPDNGYSTACDAACSALGTVGPEDVLKAVRKVAPQGAIEARRRVYKSRLRQRSLELPVSPDQLVRQSSSEESTAADEQSRTRDMGRVEQRTPFNKERTAFRGMIAITIGVGETWKKVAELAAERCHKMTGLQTAVLDDQVMARLGLTKPHHLKFRLFDEFPEADTILYFDADTIFLRPWDVRPYRHTAEFMCVPDLSTEYVVISEAQNIGVDPAAYFNSGLFIASRKPHERMFHLAEDLAGQFFSTFHDQSYLNAARDRLGLRAVYLDRRFNRLRVERAADLSEVVVGHFRWVDSKPKEMLADYFAHWDTAVRETDQRQSAAAEARNCLVNGRYNYRSGFAEFQAISFNGDKSAKIEGRKTEYFWEITMEGSNRVLWISDDETTLAWARELVGGGWQGLSTKHEFVEVRPLEAPTSRGTWASTRKRSTGREMAKVTVPS